MRNIILLALCPVVTALGVAGWHARADMEDWQARHDAEVESTLPQDEAPAVAGDEDLRRSFVEPEPRAPRGPRAAARTHRSRVTARAPAEETTTTRRSRGEGRPNLHDMLLRLADDRRVPADPSVAHARADRERHVVLGARESTLRVLAQEVRSLQGRAASTRGGTGELAGRLARASAVADRATSVVNHLRSGSRARASGEAELDSLLGELRVLTDRLRVDVDRSLAVR